MKNIADTASANSRPYHKAECHPHCRQAIPFGQFKKMAEYLNRTGFFATLNRYYVMTPKPELAQIAGQKSEETRELLNAFLVTGDDSHDASIEKQAASETDGVDMKIGHPCVRNQKEYKEEFWITGSD